MNTARVPLCSCLLSSLLIITLSQAGEASVTWFGFAQITAEGGQGAATRLDGSDDGLRFGADRVRTGFKAKRGRAFAKLQVDFKRSDVSRITAGMPEIIKDAEVGYRINPFTSIKAGMFKTPVGMDFGTSGAKLDITKRGMEKSLVLERALGVMLSGRNVYRGLGYDLGAVNPASRSTAIIDDGGGQAYAYAVRVLYDAGNSFYAEISVGLNEQAGGPDTGNYTVWDAGASYRTGGLTLKGEWVQGAGLFGAEGFNQLVWFLHGGVRVGSRFEPVIRHYQGRSEPDGSRLGNTFLGLNVFLNPDQPHATRLQLNLVIAGQSDDAWQGLGGYTGNAFLSQFQFAF